MTTNIWAATRDFQHCGILTCVDSDEPVQPHLKLRYSKWCSVSSLRVIGYSSDKQMLWSEPCWSHIPHRWKCYAAAYLYTQADLSLYGGWTGHMSGFVMCSHVHVRLVWFQSWDDELANVAQSWAEHCRIEHDEFYKRRIYGKPALLSY